MGQETGPFFKKSKLQASHREELYPVESHTDVQSQLRTKGAVAHGQGWQAINENVTRQPGTEQTVSGGQRKDSPLIKKDSLYISAESRPRSQELPESPGPAHPFVCGVDISILTKAGASQPEIQPGARPLGLASQSLTKCQRNF